MSVPTDKSDNKPVKSALSWDAPKMEPPTVGINDKIERFAIRCVKGFHIANVCLH